MGCGDQPIFHAQTSPTLAGGHLRLGLVCYFVWDLVSDEQNNKHSFGMSQQARENQIKAYEDLIAKNEEISGAKSDEKAGKEQDKEEGGGKPAIKPANKPASMQTSQVRVRCIAFWGARMHARHPRCWCRG